MPRRRVHRKKRGGRRRQRTNIRRLPGIVIPDRLQVKLPYTQRITLTTAGTPGVATDYVFRGNSPYDPDYTGVGLQPLGFDQWNSFYYRYTCTGSTIKVKFITVGSTPLASSAEVGVYPSNSTTGAAINIRGLDVLKAQPYSWWQVYGPGMALPTCKRYMGSAKLFGEPALAMTMEDDYSAPFTASPNNIWYWQIAAIAVDQTAAITLYAYVEITYYLTLHDRIINDLS